MSQGVNWQRNDKNETLMEGERGREAVQCQVMYIYTLYIEECLQKQYLEKLILFIILLYRTQP